MQEMGAAQETGGLLHNSGQWSQTPDSVWGGLQSWCTRNRALGGLGGHAGIGGYGGRGGTFNGSGNNYDGKDGKPGNPGRPGQSGEYSRNGQVGQCGGILWVVGSPTDGRIIQQSCSRYDAEVEYFNIIPSRNSGFFEPNEKLLCQM